VRILPVDGLSVIIISFTTSPQSRKIDITEDYCLKVLTLRLTSRTILRDKNILVDINAEHAYIINWEMT
jgi:hypothetical protein